MSMTDLAVVQPLHLVFPMYLVLLNVVEYPPETSPGPTMCRTPFPDLVIVYASSNTAAKPGQPGRPPPPPPPQLTSLYLCWQTAG
jgi:hypothetical protein